MSFRSILNEKLGLVLMLALVLLGISIILVATSYGMGLGSDSFYYFSGTEGIASGSGFSRPSGSGIAKPITHFPPFYSVVLAGPFAFTGELEQASRWVNTAAFGLSILLVGISLWQARLPRIIWLPILIIVATSKHALTEFSVALSDGTFIVFLLLTIVALQRYFRTGDSKLIYFMGLLSGLGYLTRYVGLVLIPTVVTVLVLIPPNYNPARVKAVFSYILVSLILPLLWIGRNYLLTGSLTNRVIGWHPPSIQKLASGLESINSWFLPSFSQPIRAAIVIGIILSGIALLINMMRARASTHPLRIQWDQPLALVSTCLFFILYYLVFLIVSLSLFDASTPLDNRILLPVYYSTMLLLAVVLADFLFKMEKPLVRSSVAVILVCFVLLSSVRGLNTAVSLQSEPHGFGSQRWREADFVDEIQALPKDTLIYSNEIDALYLLTSRSAFSIPIRWDPVQEEEREDYLEQLDLMRARLFGGGGYLLIFETLERQLEIFPSRSELTKGLCLIAQDSLSSTYKACP